MAVGDVLKGTDLIHADDGLRGLEVGPSISVTSSKSNITFLVAILTCIGTAFLRPELDQTENIEPKAEEEFDPTNPSRHEYSRYSQNISTRAELVLGKINVRTHPTAYQLPIRKLLKFSQGGYAMTYASGIAASFAVRLFYIDVIN
jgi:cystathionine gamma-synthase